MPRPFSYGTLGSGELATLSSQVTCSSQSRISVFFLLISWISSRAQIELASFQQSELHHTGLHVVGIEQPIRFR